MPHHTSDTTADELFALPDDGNRYELVEGELRMMAAAGGRHGRLAMKLARRLGAFVEEHDLGVTFAAETGFLLETNPDTVRAPDFAFVSHARIGSLADHPGYLPIAPDLVAEVVSPGDGAPEGEEKAAAWLAAGVVIVLVVDPQAKVVRCYSKQGARTDSDGFVDLGAVLAGCRFDVAELFA